MAKYEIAIAVVDETDLASGHKRKKEGDIVAIRPYPWNWGRKEIAEYLILIVNSSLSYEEIQSLTIEHTLEGYDAYPPTADTDGNEIPFTIIGKHRYRIPLDLIKQGWLPDLDLTKVRNKRYIYQPFKSNVQLVQQFDGLNGNYLLSESDVDTRTTILGSDKEADSTNGCLIDLDESVATIYDVSTDSFDNQTFKTYSGIGL